MILRPSNGQAAQQVDATPQPQPQQRTFPQPLYKNGLGNGTAVTQEQIKDFSTLDLRQDFIDAGRSNGNGAPSYGRGGIPKSQSVNGGFFGLTDDLWEKDEAGNPLQTDEEKERWRTNYVKSVIEEQDKKRREREEEYRKKIQEREQMVGTCPFLRFADVDFFRAGSWSEALSSVSKYLCGFSWFPEK